MYTYIHVWAVHSHLALDQENCADSDSDEENDGYNHSDLGKRPGARADKDDKEPTCWGPSSPASQASKQLVPRDVDFRHEPFTAQQSNHSRSINIIFNLPRETATLEKTAVTIVLPTEGAHLQQRRPYGALGVLNSRRGLFGPAAPAASQSSITKSKTGSSFCTCDVFESPSLRCTCSKRAMLVWLRVGEARPEVGVAAVPAARFLVS